MEPGAMKLAPATEEALDYEVAPNSEEVAVVSEEAPESELAPNSEEALDLKMAMDSIEVPLVVPDNVEMVVDSVERDFVECLCPRCGTIHAGGVFGEECFQARRRARMCARCGLLHEDYELPARFFHFMEKFDCEFYIPDVEKLQMRGNTILLLDDVVEKLEEIHNMKKLEDAKMKQDEKKEQ